MGAIWISQWLCEKRHCSIALGWDDSESTQAAIVAQGEAVYSSGSINRWCGICGGGLRVEHGKSIFKTMNELNAAKPLMEIGQMIARAEIERVRDSNKN